MISTINSAMGDTLYRVALQFTIDESDNQLWDRGQVAALFTRGGYGK